MTNRRPLSQRRACETFVVECKGHYYHVSAGYYRDGTLGEVFISGAKEGTDMDGVCRDGAVLLSLALQHGVPLSTMASALSKNSDGTPSTVIGVVAARLLS